MTPRTWSTGASATISRRPDLGLGRPPTFGTTAGVRLAKFRQTAAWRASCRACRLWVNVQRKFVKPTS
jgi:hypothetical protein